MDARISDTAERFIASQVESGRYRSAAEVIEVALRLMEQGEPAQPGIAASDEALQRRLLAAGLVGEIKPPIIDLSPYRDRRAVPIRGEPLSETVIRERR